MIQWYVCTRSFCVPALLPSFPVTNLQGEPKPVPPLPGANAETSGLLPSNFGPKFSFLPASD